MHYYLPLLHKNPEELFLLVPAYPGSPGPKAVKRLCVCVCVCTNIVHIHYSSKILIAN